MKRLVLCLALSACSAPQDADFAGNVFPPQCQDVADIHPDIVEVAPSVLAGMEARMGYRRWGQWSPYAMSKNPHGVVLIDNTLSGWKREEVLKHERCHAAMFVRVGNPHWHR